METVGAVVFFGGMLTLLVIVVWQSLGGPSEKATMTIRTPNGEVRVNIHEDGWGVFAKIVDSKVVRSWERYVWDEDVVSILQEAGLSSTDARVKAYAIANPPSPPSRKLSRKGARGPGIPRS